MLEYKAHTGLVVTVNITKHDLKDLKFSVAFVSIFLRIVVLCQLHCPCFVKECSTLIKKKKNSLQYATKKQPKSIAESRKKQKCE